MELKKRGKNIIMDRKHQCDIKILAPGIPVIQDCLNIFRKSACSSKIQFSKALFKQITIF